jgi:L-fuconolactonase
VGAIVAGAPQGFGVAGADDAQVAAALDQLAALPLARGIRAAALNFSDASAFETMVKHTSMLAQRRLSLDVITAVNTAGTAAAIARLAAAVPAATIILDHMGSPQVHDSASFASWALAMGELAQQDNIFVKVGGLLQYFKGEAQPPTAERMAPFVKATLQAFGFQRALFESNWFFVNWPGRMDLYQYWVTALRSLLHATPDQQQHLFYLSAEKAYRILPSATQ